MSKKQSKRGRGTAEYVQISLPTRGSAEPHEWASYRSLDDSERKALLIAFLALASVKGVGLGTLQELFDAGVLQDLMSLGATELQHQRRINVTKPRQIWVKAITENRAGLIEEGRKAAEALTEQGITFAPIGHASYPRALLKIQSVPRWIFVKGNLRAVHSGTLVAVIGTREASPEGLQLAYRCARELVQRNLIVLSGLAKGIDEQAHTGAIEAFGQSVAILGHGLDPVHLSDKQRLVDKLLEMDGALVTEYLPADPPSRQRFLRRNEIQAALSRVVIPIECPSLESGTGATIRRALHLKTPVIGIIPGGVQTGPLKATSENLQKLGLPVFPVMGKNSMPFWEQLGRHLSIQSWDMSPEPRQSRALQVLLRQFVQASRMVPMDEAALVRFVQLARQQLQQQASQPNQSLSSK